MAYQIPLLEPACDWKPPSMSDLPTDWGNGDVAVDVETYDPNLKETGPSIRTGGHMVGIGFAIDGGPAHYLPFAHLGGGNMDPVQVKNYIRDMAKKFTGRVVGANLGYDLDWLWEDDIFFNECQGYRDVLIAEPLIDENQFYYSLDKVATKWLGDQKKKTVMIEAAKAWGMQNDKDVGNWIHVVPGQYVGEYGEADNTLPLRVLKMQEAEIERQGIQDVWDLESRLLPVLVKMRRRGVRVNEDRLMEIELRCAKERMEAADFITRESGVAVGPDDASKNVLLTQAFQAVGMDVNHGDSLDKHFIARWADEVPVVAALGRLRKWDTLRKLSIDPVKTHLVDGRIHCSFNQLAADKDGEKGTKGARYGRMSCEHVNMQQQPARDEEIGPLWRKIYEPEEGAQWAACDYASQEPRMTVHWAETLALLEVPGFPMTGAKEAAQTFRDEPRTDFHQMMADMAGVGRKSAKAIFLGLCYNMGPPKLCRSLGLPVKQIQLTRGPRKGEWMEVAGDEGEKLFNTFHAKVPFVRQLDLLCKERAKQNGFIKTLIGRRCRFPIGDDGMNYWKTYTALNRLIQGSSADQTKMAMVEADAAGIPLQLQVHDEIDFSTGSDSEAKKLGQVMSDCLPLNVPSVVDVEVGPNWGEANRLVE